MALSLRVRDMKSAKRARACRVTQLCEIGAKISSRVLSFLWRKYIRSVQNGTLSRPLTIIVPLTLCLCRMHRCARHDCLYAWNLIKLIKFVFAVSALLFHARADLHDSKFAIDQSFHKLRGAFYLILTIIIYSALQIRCNSLKFRSAMSNQNVPQ